MRKNSAVLTAALLLSLSTAPSALAAPNRLDLLSPASGQALETVPTFLWRGTPGTTGYTIEVCSDLTCGTVVQRAIGLRGEQWTSPELPPGAYAWRVIALNAQGRSSEASKTRPFKILPTLSGHVSEDVLADNSQRVVRPGVTLRLFRDADDSPIGSTITDASGGYTFRPSQHGSYSIAVVESSITPSAGWAGPSRDAKADQTAGPAGSLCLAAGGKQVELAQGRSCFGGRWATALDDPSRLSSARYVARVRFDGGSHRDLDFFFSFNVVTNTVDNAAGQPAIPGSLRQFVLNANAIQGPNTMHFVPEPVDRAESESAKWWTILLQQPLPSLVDRGTTLDGSVFDRHEGSLKVDTNPGVVGELAKAIPTGEAVAARRPQLEVVLADGSSLIAETMATFQRIAITGTGNGIVARTGLIASDLVVGGRPDGRADYPPDLGIQLEGGRSNLRSVYVTSARRSGILVGPNAVLDADSIEVTDCGSIESGGGIALAGNGSTIQRSFIHRNPGFGIAIGASVAGGSAAHNTVADSSLTGNFSGVLLAEGAEDNIVTGNDLVWNRGGGVLSATARPASRNRISRNNFNENAGVAVALRDDRPGTSEGSCKGNDLLQPPRIESGGPSSESDSRQLVVRGTACPHATVELYGSFVTEALRQRVLNDQGRDLSSVREALGRESLESRDQAGGWATTLPAIGEFRFLASAMADADGSFTLRIPIDQAFGGRNEASRRSRLTDGTDQSSSGSYAVAALAIDPVGNTSEFSRRRLIRLR